MKERWLKRIAGVPNLTRRKLLSFIGGTIAVTLLGCSRRQTASTTSTNTSTTINASTKVSPSTTPTCVVRPEQTEGPYFRDERLNRSDIRSDPSDGSVKPGTLLQLVFQISQIEGRSCTPLSNAIVDIWHCDADGIYSDVRDPQFNTSGKKFLRGYQVTNADGIAEFLTIYPGWYPGRTVHIHFKIRADSASHPIYEFTSQLYFDDGITDQIHAQPPYRARGYRTNKNNEDGIFQRGGEQLIVRIASIEEGYLGRFNIGLEIT